MKLFTQTKRKKLEIKPVKLSYYSHNSENKNPLGLKNIPRKFKSGLKIVLVFLLIGGVISVTYYLFSRYKFLEVNEVLVYGDNKYVSVKDVQKSAEHLLKGKSLLTLKPNIYQNSLLNSYRSAKAINIRTKWPNKVIVSIAERQPVAILSSVEKKYLVDQEGYVLGEVKESDKGFSEVAYEEKVEVGTFIHQNIVPTSVKLIDLAKEANLSIKKMKFNSQYITLNINDNIEIDLSLAEDNTLAMKQIAAIIEKTSLDGQKLRKVDLRFEKVIVLYD